MNAALGGSGSSNSTTKLPANIAPAPTSFAQLEQIVGNIFG